MKRLLILGMALVAAGCATQPVAPVRSPDWDERRGALSELSGWEAKGRIAVKSGNEGGQGSILWNQQGERSRIRLSGPFGAGGYDIEWAPGSLLIADGNGDIAARYSGDNAVEQFLDDQLGWSFPAEPARYWILGLPHPRFESLEHFDTDGWLQSIEQNGWTVTYDRFESAGDHWLPKKLVIENDHARVKLFVDRWSL